MHCGSVRSVGSVALRQKVQIFQLFELRRIRRPIRLRYANIHQYTVEVSGFDSLMSAANLPAALSKTEQTASSFPDQTAWRRQMVQIHAHARTHTHTHTPWDKHTYMHTDTHTLPVNSHLDMQWHAHTHTHTHTHIHTRTHTHNAYL